MREATSLHLTILISAYTSPTRRYEQTPVTETYERHLQLAGLVFIESAGTIKTTVHGSNVLKQMLAKLGSTFEEKA